MLGSSLGRFGGVIIFGMFIPANYVTSFRLCLKVVDDTVGDVLPILIGVPRCLFAPIVAFVVVELAVPFRGFARVCSAGHRFMLTVFSIMSYMMRATTASTFIIL